MSITFGSVGDIIAVGQIAWSLAKALTDSKGSAKEYQGLIKELQTFDQALLQVVALWQNYESSPELDQLGAITKDAVKDWRDTLLGFRVKIDKKYGTSLGARGSGSWVKDAGKRVVWLKEKEDILDLRRKLGSASDTITMLTLAAMGKSNRLAESTMECRVQAVHCLLLESKTLAEEHVAQLKRIDERMDSQSKTSDLILRNVEGGVRTLTHVHTMTVDIKNILSLFQSHIISQQFTPRGLVTGWQQDPVTLEDALGFRIPLPLELVNSWDMFDMILRKRFEKRHGHQKVLKGEFAIEEGATGKDVSREHEFCMSFRPGQKIDMSMVFLDLNGASNYCPRCGTQSEASAEIRTQCYSCRMWFQSLVEIDDSEPELVPERNGHPVTIKGSVQVKKSRVPVSTPADFQRVRLLSKLRLRERREKVERNAAKDELEEAKKDRARAMEERIKTMEEPVRVEEEKVRAKKEQVRVKEEEMRVAEEQFKVALEQFRVVEELRRVAEEQVRVVDELEKAREERDLAEKKLEEVRHLRRRFSGFADLIPQEEGRARKQGLAEEDLATPGFNARDNTAEQGMMGLGRSKSSVVALDHRESDFAARRVADNDLDSGPYATHREGHMYQLGVQGADGYFRCQQLDGPCQGVFKDLEELQVHVEVSHLGKGTKAPITPPIADADFLKTISMASPSSLERALKRLDEKVHKVRLDQRKGDADKIILEEELRGAGLDQQEAIRRPNSRAEKSDEGVLETAEGVPSQGESDHVAQTDLLARRYMVDSDSEAEGIVLLGKDGHSTSKIWISIKHEDKSADEEIQQHNPSSNSYASTLSIAASSITSGNSYGRVSPGGISPVPIDNTVPSPTSLPRESGSQSNGIEDPMSNGSKIKLDSAALKLGMMAMEPDLAQDVRAALEEENVQDPPESGIQFIRFGDDEASLKRLGELDDELGLQLDIGDTTSSDENVWKMVLGAIDKDFDEAFGPATEDEHIQNLPKLRATR